MKTYSILLLLIIYSITLFSQVKISYKTLEIGEHWSKRIVEEENKKRYYFRPKRFEFMEINTNNTENIQIRGILSKKSNSIIMSVKIDKSVQKHKMKISNFDEKYYYLETIDLNIPKNTEKIYIKTRNPNTYFRVYEIVNDGNEEE
jgi:hypothetical protein